MPYALTDLVGMVRISIRDNGTPQAFPDTGVPNNSPELSQFVTASLAEYSRYRPLKKSYTLNIVAGTTTYSLPTDWITVEAASFDAAAYPQEVPDLKDYLLPYVTISAPLGTQQQAICFDWYDDAQQVILSVAPVANYTLTFDYYAQQTPATVPLQWLDAALAPACERALRALAADQAVKLQQYRMANGKLEVDNRTIKDALLKQAEDWRKIFHKEVVMRPHATMG